MPRLRILLSFVLALVLGVAGARDVFKLELPPPKTPVDLAAGGSVQFIGNATVLIRYQGFTILTDPNFLHKGQKVRLGLGTTAERLTNPGVELADLPPVDLVILSHWHEDHFDREVQDRFDKSVPIITTRQAAGALGKAGFERRYSLADWDAVDVTKGNARLRITAMPGKHGLGVRAAALPHVMGSVLDFGGGKYRIYISGDTVAYDGLDEIPKRFPQVDLALLYLGGTRIMRSLGAGMNGADGVRLMRSLGPRMVIPVHFDDYDVFKSPLTEFQNAVKTAGLDTKVVYLRHGESYTFVPGSPVVSSTPP